MGIKFWTSWGVVPTIFKIGILPESGVRRNVRIPYPYLIFRNNPYLFPYPYQNFQQVTYPYPSTYFFSKINPYPVPNSVPILENHPYLFPSPYPFFWLFLRSQTRTYFRTFSVHFTYSGFLESTIQRKSNAAFEFRKIIRGSLKINRLTKKNCLWR